MATLSIRIPEEIGEQLEKPAASTGRTRSFPALDVLRRYLAQEEWQTQAVRTAVEKADSGTTKYASHDAVDHWPAGRVWGATRRDGAIFPRACVSDRLCTAGTRRSRRLALHKNGHRRWCFHSVNRP
ncbi:MAG: ribbon-helix-helix domain-containing protein [Thiogranum sp.]